VLTDAIERVGLDERFTIAVDVAASHFHRDGRYHLKSENRILTSGEMVDMLTGWTSEYPVSSIEDGLEEDDWHGWRTLTSKAGWEVQLVGDDLFTTNAERLRYGIGIGAANAVLVKMNQIGTLTETFEVVDIARKAGYAAVISARSGETEDSFLADLAVACGSGQIKIGSVTRSERLSKYNRLLSIERELER
jgi:enolase